MKPGLFVSFEGIEGCGKTTQIAALSRLLTERALPHTITREPGGTAVGDGIRKIVLNSATIHLTTPAELLLFYASRSQNIQEKIRPALERGETVICDRYFDASMAYQGYGRGVPLDFIEQLTKLVCANYRPDLTVLLDIDAKTGLGRARARNNLQVEDEGRFEAEDLEFYGRVRDGYLELARKDPERIRVIRADRTIDEVGEEIRRVLDMEVA
jgi:dTMP kinase